MPGCAVTKTHKILHHAWRHLFTLIDRQTMTRLGDNLWLTIYKDLNEYEEQFDELETWFATLAGARGGVPLTRLRLYDLLLWCGVVFGGDTGIADKVNDVLAQRWPVESMTANAD